MRVSFCKTCAAWDEIIWDDFAGLKQTFGICRRFAPRIIENDHEHAGDLNVLDPVWPQTSAQDWCLEYILDVTKTRKPEKQ